jgi:hypothetical protein
MRQGCNTEQNKQTNKKKLVKTIGKPRLASPQSFGEHKTSPQVKSNISI